MNNPLQNIFTRILGIFFFLLIITLTGCDKKETVYPDGYDPDAVQSDPNFPPYTSDGPTYTETQEITEHVIEALVLTDIHDDPDKTDYIVTLDSWEIEATLTIESGVVLEFAKNAEINVKPGGVLYCGYYQQKDTKFTCQEKTAGSWLGIKGHPNSRIILSHTVIEYAGGSLLQQANPLASTIQTEGDLTLVDSEIRHSNGYGLRTFNTGRLFYVDDNRFKDIAKAAISTTADQIHAIGMNHEFSRNGHNGVLVRSSTLEDGPCPAPWETLTYTGSASYLIENEDPTIPAEILITTDLELKPGVKMVFGEGAGLKVKADVGKITAIGTASDKIIFEGKQSENGFWKGIFLEQSRETSIFKHTTIKHGGSTTFDDQLLPSKGNIGVNAAKLNISFSTISFSDGCAFATHQTQSENALIIENNNIFNNNEGGQYCGQ